MKHEKKIYGIISIVLGSIYVGSFFWKPIKSWESHAIVVILILAFATLWWLEKEEVKKDDDED